MAKKTNYTNATGNEYFRTSLHIGYDANGKKIQKVFYGKSRKEALEKKQNYIDYELTSNNSTVKNELIGIVLHSWLFDIVKIEVKPSSFEKYEGFYRNHIKDSYFAKIKLSKVSTSDIQSYLNQIYNNGAKATLIKNLFSFINKFFNYQCKLKIIKENPCTHIILPKDNVVKEKIEIFSTDEINIFKTATEENFDYFIFYFGIATGLRQGEMIALTLDDIDLINDTINIDKTTNKIYVFNEDGTKYRVNSTYPPKSKNSIRKVPIPEQIKPLMEQQYSQQQNINQSLFFTNKLNNEYDGDKLYEKYKRFLKRYGIKHRKFHTLRHTYCSILARNNVPLKIAAELMGHDVEMTSKIYTHINLDDKKNALKSISF